MPLLISNKPKPAPLKKHTQKVFEPTRATARSRLQRFLHCAVMAVNSLSRAGSCVSVCASALFLLFLFFLWSSVVSAAVVLFCSSCLVCCI